MYPRVNRTTRPCVPDATSRQYERGAETLFVNDASSPDDSATAAGGDSGDAAGLAITRTEPIGTSVPRSRTVPAIAQLFWNATRAPAATESTDTIASANP